MKVYSGLFLALCLITAIQLRVAANVGEPVACADVEHLMGSDCFGVSGKDQKTCSSTCGYKQKPILIKGKQAAKTGMCNDVMNCTARVGIQEKVNCGTSPR